VLPSAHGWLAGLKDGAINRMVRLGVQRFRRTAPTLVFVVGTTASARVVTPLAA
jgi:hypothetical protein